VNSKDEEMIAFEQLQAEMDELQARLSIRTYI